MIFVIKKPNRISLIFPLSKNKGIYCWLDYYQLELRTQWSFQTQISGLSNSIITISKCMVGVLIIVCFMFVFDIKYWLDQTVQTTNYPVEYKRERMIDYFLCTSPFWKDCSKKKKCLTSFNSSGNFLFKTFSLKKKFPLWKDFYFSFFLIT